jgi:hypothetical protein
MPKATGPENSVLIFLYLVAAMGVAYWAQLHGRNAALWFVISAVITPLGGSLALMAADKFGFRA